MFFFHSLKALETHTREREKKKYFFDNNEPLNPDFFFSIVSISLLVEMVFFVPSLFPPRHHHHHHHRLFMYSSGLFFLRKKQPRGKMKKKFPVKFSWKKKSFFKINRAVSDSNGRMSRLKILSLCVSFHLEKNDTVTL